MVEKPNRCPVTPDSDKFRHLLYGNKPHIYRAIYRVLEKQKRVEVLHFRHGARQKFKGPMWLSAAFGVMRQMVR